MADNEGKSKSSNMLLWLLALAPLGAGVYFLLNKKKSPSCNATLLLIVSPSNIPFLYTLINKATNQVFSDFVTASTSISVPNGEYNLQLKDVNNTIFSDYNQDLIIGNCEEKIVNISVPTECIGLFKIDSFRDSNGNFISFSGNIQIIDLVNNKVVVDENLINLLEYITNLSDGSYKLILNDSQFLFKDYTDTFEIGFDNITLKCLFYVDNVILQFN